MKVEVSVVVSTLNTILQTACSECSEQIRKSYEKDILFIALRMKVQMHSYT